MAGVPPPTSTVCHGHHRAHSGEPPSQPSVPIDAGRRGKALGGDLTAGDLVSDELGPVSVALCFGVTDGWGPVDHGPRISVCIRFDFLNYFTDLNACFKNSYLELGVSNFGEPNFVGFLMKCSIL